MADATPPLPPNVANFKKKLDAKTALKAERDQIERWRQGKCPPEFHGIVDELIARWDASSDTIQAALKQELIVLLFRGHVFSELLHRFAVVAGL